MGLLILFILCSFVFAALGLAAFELTVALLLLSPLLYYLTLLLQAPSAFLAWQVLILTFAVLLFVSTNRFKFNLSRRIFKELDASLVFVGAFLLLYSLSLAWPDFIAMGERLRDYSILAAVVKEPLHPQEPWMSGSGLYYYIYWYRFGAFLGSLFAQPVWSVYHQLISFSLALYVAVLYLLFRKHLGFTWLASLFCSSLISFGSNIAGVIAFFEKDNNWWGPSRVIPGAINEFPVWSFLLGDLHPHYLNLAAIPFLLLIVLAALNPGNQIFLRLPAERFILLIALLIVPPLWLKASNAWEIPMWLGLVLVFALLLAALSGKRLLHIWRRVLPTFKNLLSARALLALTLLVLVCAGLISSTPRIPAGEGNQLRFVADTIAESRTFDLLKHWGLPLFLIGLANTLLLPGMLLKCLAAVFLLGALFFDSAPVLIYVLLLFNSLRLLLSFGMGEKKIKGLGFSRLVLESVGLAALVLLLLPEVVFLDDPYGGENERMNTIFKVYTTDWFLLHLFAFWIFAQCSEILRKIFEQETLVYIAALLILVSFIGFTYRTIPLRLSQPTDMPAPEQGLGEVERRFPGSAQVIRELRAMPAGVVLEAQGNAYDYTSFVSTLSAQQSYLGWANHVNLITKEYGEVTRREKVTQEFYSNSDCQTKASLLKAEKITYVVYGSLEKLKFPQSKSEDFSCLIKLASNKEYALFGLPS